MRNRDEQATKRSQRVWKRLAAVAAALVFVGAVAFPLSLADRPAADIPAEPQAAQIENGPMPPVRAPEQNLNTLTEQKPTVNQSIASDDGIERAHESNVAFVQFTGEGTAESLSTALAELPFVANATVTTADVEAGFMTVPLEAGVNLAMATNTLARIPGIGNAQPNYHYYLLDDDPGLRAGRIATTPAEAGDSFSALEDVNDTYGKKSASASYNWHLESVGAYDAWSIAKGAGANPRVAIAIIDTGYDYDHPDLTNGASSGIDGNVIARYNATGNGPTDDAADIEGHGTHVAGIAAAITNNNTGVAGLSYNANLVPIRVFEWDDEERDYIATTESLVSAYEFIETHRSDYNIRVANLSLGAKQESEILDNSDYALRTAVETAFNNGVLTVCAAGNDAQNGPYLEYPIEILPHCMGVIALNSSEQRADFSNYNVSDTMRNKDISAPGSSIYSTTSNGSYGYKSGTSMASPLVSGIAALVFSANQNLSAQEVIDILHNTAIDLIYTNGSEVAGSGFDRYTGFGKINAAAAVSAAKSSAYIVGDDSLFVGDSTTLSLLGNVTDEVSWSSSSESVASVTASGVVTGNNPGTTVITATMGALSFSKTITVYRVSFSLVPSGTTITSHSMRVGESFDVRLNTQPSTGQWNLKESNSSVITLSASSYSNALRLSGKSAGECNLIATNSTNNKLQAKLAIVVAKRPLSDTSVSLSSTAYTYDGSAKQPSPTVTLNGKTLQNGTDYTCKWENNVNAGTASVTLTGKGSYTGTVTKHFTINKAPIKSMALSTQSYTYNGATKSPSVTVKGPNDKTLRAGTDYALTTPSGRTNAGTYTYTAKGAGNYTGAVSVKMYINRASLSNASVTVSPSTFTYDGRAKTPSVTVRYSGKTLKAGTDYTLSLPVNRVSSGTKWATVSGKGNYTGSKSASYVIKAVSAPKSTSPAPSATPAPKRITMHRLYNPNSGEHLYTSSSSERDSLVRIGWNFEGTAWIAPSTGTPVYRLYNPNSGDHHYTTSASERDSLSRIGWRYEGVGWYSYTAKSKPLYRLFNPNVVIGTHHYTTSASERNHLASIGWRYEGVGWYGM